MYFYNIIFMYRRQTKNEIKIKKNIYKFISEEIFFLRFLNFYTYFNVLGPKSTGGYINGIQYNFLRYFFVTLYIGISYKVTGFFIIIFFFLFWEKCQKIFVFRGTSSFYTQLYPYITT